MIRMRTFIVAAFAAAGLLAAGPAHPQSTVNPFAGMAQDSDQPIKIAADATLADFNAQTATYTGNVVVTQGQMILRADELKIFAPDGAITKIEARGKVVLSSPSGSAQSPLAVYEVGPRLVTMSGGVVLKHENNVMRGSALVVNLATGGAKLQAPQGEGGKPGRVEGLFVPSSKPQGPGAAPPAPPAAEVPVPRPKPAPR